MVRWAAASPLATDDHDVTVHLVGGTTVNPDGIMVFAGAEESPVTSVKSHKASQLADSISFHVNISHMVQCSEFILMACVNWI